MKRAFVMGLMSMTILTSCQQPPPYESPGAVASFPTVEPPQASTLPPAAPPPIEASFSDTFNRPDTEFGLGDGWDLRGPGADAHSVPLPPATDGFIKDGSYTYAGTSVVSAVRQVRATVQRVGASGRWRRIGRGTETTLALAITANDLIVTDMVHLAVNRSVWNLTVRRGNGAFEPVATGRFNPILEVGRDYRFEFQATDNAITVMVPGAEVTKEVSTVGVLGDRAFWQERPTRSPAGNVFDFDTVWALEAGQPVFEVQE